VWVLTVALTRYVSLGSILAAMAFLAAVSGLYYDPVLVAVFTALTAFVIFRHRANIRRLMRGTENRLGGERPSAAAPRPAPPAAKEPGEAREREEGEGDGRGKGELGMGNRESGTEIGEEAGGKGKCGDRGGNVRSSTSNVP
jgi:hypothetical protein